MRRSIFLCPSDSLTAAVALWVAGAVFGTGSCLGDSPDSPDSPDFARDVRPILSDKCFQCHGPDRETRKAGLRLDVEAEAKADLGGYAAIVPGRPGESELIRRITHTDADERMPPASLNRPLSPDEIRILERWIDGGATWRGHWSFVPPTRPAIPDVALAGWARNPIDRFVLDRLKREGLTPSAEADRRTLIRRITLDLTGLPPGIDEVNDFLADRSPAAYERVVDRLLNSSEFGERMAWTWLEAARYADTDGYQNDGPRDMWRWRDWVIAAYNANMPFDQFTVEQLSGDLLPEPGLDQIIATGFNRNHRYNSEAGLVTEEFLLENAVDRVDTTSTVWMGLTLGCARCHSHKYDPFTHEEYYRLIALFDNVPESGRAIKFGNSEPWVRAPTDAQQGILADWDRRIQSARANLSAAEPAIRDRLETWIPNASDSNNRPFLSRGLKHFFAFDPGDERVVMEKGNPRSAPGRCGPAAVFDGESQVALGKVGGLLCNTRFSIAFWMKPDAVGRGAVLSQETADSTRKGLLIEFADGRLRFHIISRWLAGLATVETERTDHFKRGQWVHVTVTNDGTQRADGMKIFVDGHPVATRTTANTNSNRAAKSYGGDLRVGGSPHAPHFTGAVDELRIYQRTLWPDEIRRLAVPETIPRIIAKPAPDRDPAEHDKLTAHYLEQGPRADHRALLDAYEAARAGRLEYEDRLPTTMVMRDREPPTATHVRTRGVYDQLGARVTPGVPAALDSGAGSPVDNRLDFARWLVSPGHPLTARVAVNRYWQMFLGRGLVPTPEDFGSQGEAPTHPELLDWLATEFVRLDWNVKTMVKTIVTSATYRQSSAATPDRLRRDPENRLLARANRIRLAGNVLRDQALALGDLLVPVLGGPSVKPYQPENLWREASNFVYQPGSGSELYRRSLYTYWKRTLAPPAMAVLDTADREWCSVRPKRTNTPLQALALLNEPAFFEAAQKLAVQLVTRHPADIGERIRSAFERVTSRRPQPAEADVLIAAYAGYRNEYAEHPKRAEQVLGVGDSPIPDDLDRTDLAATTALSNLLLNLDEATTRE